MSTKDRKLQLVLDSRDPQRLAPFWAAALGYQVTVDVDNYVLPMPVDQGGPKLFLQKVPEDKVLLRWAVSYCGGLNSIRGLDRKETKMRKLIVSTFLTRDGVMQAPAVLKRTTMAASRTEAGR